jgi:hypothetical protein
MKQGLLFDTAGLAPPETLGWGHDGEIDPASPSARWPQPGLFDAIEREFGDLEADLAQGEFEAARERWQRMAGCGDPRHGQLGFLRAIPQRLWDRPLDALLGTWRGLQAALAHAPSFRLAATRGFLRHLLLRHSADRVVRCDLTMLPLIYAHLAGADARGLPGARAVVRDLLLDGLDPSSLRIEDPALADLLGEEEDPRWLACRGAVLHLWSAPPAGPEERRRFASGMPDQPARAFWLCLQMLEMPELDHDVRHEARRRMKRLNAGLHRLHMEPDART